MQPFETLTRRGKARRLRQLALNALAQYPVAVAELRLVGMFTNTLFRLRTADGAAYAVRVCAPGWRTLTDLQSEAMWLAALAATAPEIGAPVVLHADAGGAVVEAAAPGVRPCRVLVMSWRPGVLLGRRLDAAHLEKMGALFARLHAQAAGWTPPAGFTTRRLTHYLSRDEPEVLFDDPALWDGGAAAMPPEIAETLLATRARVLAAYAAVAADAAGWHVIHNDLWHDNIKVYRGRLFPLDFEDTVWGTAVLDIAPALQDLMEDVPAGAFAPLQAAFRRSYTQHRPWPEAYEGQIDIFRAGRLLWVANYVARFERPHLQGYLARVAPLLARFLATGKVRKAPE